MSRKGAACRGLQSRGPGFRGTNKKPCSFLRLSVGPRHAQASAPGPTSPPAAARDWVSAPPPPRGRAGGRGQRQPAPIAALAAALPGCPPTCPFPRAVGTAVPGAGSSHPPRACPAAEGAARRPALPWLRSARPPPALLPSAAPRSVAASARSSSARTGPPRALVLRPAGRPSRRGPGGGARPHPPRRGSRQPISGRDHKLI